MSKLIALFTIITISTAFDGTDSTDFNIAFYNTAQSRHILESVNDISGNNPPPQQTAQIEEIRRQSEELDLDVFCLSNLLLPKQLNDYKTSLQDLFPYSLSQLDIKPESDFDTPRTACTASNFAEFQSADITCSQDALLKCDEVLRKPETNVMDFQICLAQQCPLNYQRILYSECISCMNIFTEANNWDPNIPGQALGLAAWGCSMQQERVMNFTDGVVILSKYEIKNSWSVAIPSFIFYEQRLNVVQLDVAGNDVLIGCVDMNPTTYKDNSASYVAVTEQQRTDALKSHIELNEVQIERIITGMDDIVGDAEQATVALMGDLGVGQRWNADNFAMLTFEGYENFGGGGCTFCVDKETDGIYYNTVAAEDSNLFDSSVNKDLDHILLRNGGNQVKVNAWSRFMEQKYNGENEEELPYSSRWGVVMALQFDKTDT